jgi:N-acyl-D-aspartate/D-glutamate deacylase
MVFDIIVRGGTILDGTGSKPFEADVAVRDAKVHDIGRFGHVSARQTVDAHGMLVSPGFIDIHGHSDLSILVCPGADSKIMQGVTTEISGNCGESAGPISDESIDDFRAAGARFGISVDWRSLGHFLKRIEGNISINYGTLVGLGTVRGAVMGSVDRPPDPRELSQMKTLVEQSLAEGALGVSTGLVYPPGMYADTDEVCELTACASGDSAFYATHMRNEAEDIDSALKEAFRITERTGVPLQISHLKTVGKRNWGKIRNLLAKLERAAERDIDVTADRYPYTASATGLTALLPRWAHEGGRAELLARLKSEKERSRMKAAVGERIDEVGWDSIMVTNTWSASNRNLEGKSFAESASLCGLDPFDLLAEVVLASDGLASIVAFSQSEDDMLLTLSHPLVMLGSDSGIRSMTGVLAEGKPHPRAYGTFPAFYRIFVRQRRILSPEEAIHRMTGMPARRLRLAGRGLLRKGHWADIVVFDGARFEDTATYQNPHSHARGVECVIVNGKLTVLKGVHTNSRSGMVLRGGS